MSENFEKIILEKLETLENGQNEQKEELELVRQDLKNQKDKLDLISNELKEREEKLDIVSSDLKEYKEKLDFVSNDLRSFSQHFAVFEYDFSLKVDTLFEKYDTDFSQHKGFKKDINSLKDDSFKYGVQIEHLSKKIANA